VSENGGEHGRHLACRFIGSKVAFFAIYNAALAVNVF